MWQIGIVVADREAATEALSAALGVSWANQQRVIEVSHLGEPQSIELRFALAQQGPVHLEVLEAQVGTPWWPPHGLDHVARWAGDLRGTAERLERLGSAREVTYQAADGGPTGFTYHRVPAGMRIEHVDVGRRDAMLRWIAGGDYPDIAGGDDGPAADDSDGGTDTAEGYSPTTFGIGRPFHVGQVVTDLVPAMTELTEGLGIEWHPIQERTMHLRSPSGVQKVGLRFTYSQGAEPHIELLEGDAGSIWGPEYKGFHHIGVWTTDFLSDVSHLEAAGFPVEITLASRSTDGPNGFTYQTNGDGVRIELVPTEMRPAFDNWFSGGSFASP